MAISVVTTGTSTTGALGFTATAGRIVVCALGVRNWNVTWNSGGGWTLLQKWDDNTNGQDPNIFLFAKVAAGGETTVGGSFNNDAGRAAVAIEVTGATLTGTSGSANKSPNSATGPIIPAITPTAGREALVVMTACHRGAGLSGAGEGAPWSSLAVNQNGNQWPFMGMKYRVVNPASGSYGPITYSVSGDWYAWANAYILSPLVAVSARAVIV